MTKKLLLASLIFLYSCAGYVPLFSEKTNFKFNSVELEGEEMLNEIILRNIENLENKNSNDIKFIDLKINTQKIKKIHSKDSKGDPNKYKIEIKTVLEIEFENDINLKKNFFVSDIFDDFESQFELNKYEKKTTKILTERLSEKIIVYLRTIE
jgi:hypothetical protein|tara:strand:- start:1834 stop:2292 length:459 start_codon:yes stop_codon:yes gene_type:complete